VGPLPWNLDMTKEIRNSSSLIPQGEEVQTVEAQQETVTDGGTAVRRPSEQSQPQAHPFCPCLLCIMSPTSLAKGPDTKCPLR
jgi:hypothetical protein